MKRDKIWYLSVKTNNTKGRNLDFIDLYKIVCMCREGGVNKKRGNQGGGGRWYGRQFSLSISLYFSSPR